MLKKLLQKLFPFLFSTQTYLAFGVEESPNKYPLDKARYLTIASHIHDESVKQGRSLKVLDVGCNEGMMLLYCKRNQTPVEFYGMDILEKKLETCLARGYHSVALQDIRNFPYSYPDHFFDVVICSHILEHLEQPGEVLHELNRIMKKGGILLVGVPIGLLPGILYRRHITPIFSPRHGKEESLRRFGHVTFFTLPDLRNLLKRYHFQVEDARADFFLRARKFFLENYKWWFDFNQWYGKLFPGVAGHVSVKARLLA